MSIVYSFPHSLNLMMNLASHKDSKFPSFQIPNRESTRKILGWWSFHSLSIFVLCHFFTAPYYLWILYLFTSHAHAFTCWYHIFMLHIPCYMSYSISTCPCTYITCILFHVLSLHLSIVCYSLWYILFCMVKGLLNKCLCQINPKVIQMKTSCKAGRSWVSNTFPRTYLSSGPNPRLVPLYMDSKLVPRSKNQVTTHFLRPSPWG